jgi:hypothetical protein
MLPYWVAAASFVPSAEEVISRHSVEGPLTVQVNPLSVDVTSVPSVATAASFEPSAEEVMEVQSLVVPLANQLVDTEPSPQ